MAMVQMRPAQALCLGGMTAITAAAPGAPAAHPSTQDDLGARRSAVSHAAGAHADADDCEAAWIPTNGGWSSIGYSEVIALVVHDDGSGPAVYACGDFRSAGGTSTDRIARWDGARWAPLGSGLSGNAFALAVFDDGSGPAVYVGGDFSTAGGTSARNIARWDGASWAPLGEGLNNAVESLAVFDDGTGPALYAGGLFTMAGGGLAARIAKWDGRTWSPLGSGVNARVHALAVFDDGTGPALYAGGRFTVAGDIASDRIARWDGTGWAPLGSGLSGIPNAFVLSLAAFDDGTGPALYAGGGFTMAGSVYAPGIARWNGTEWTEVGSGTDDAVAALCVFDDGSGRSLYAGGTFTTAGGVPTGNVARWNGVEWTSPGPGFPGGWQYKVNAFAVMEHESDPMLYVGGSFQAVDGISFDRTARWDGTRWLPLTNGLNGYVRALAVDEHDGESVLYVGGAFSTAGGAHARRIARWDGTSWSSLDGGIRGPSAVTSVRAILPTRSPSGDTILMVGGAFTIAGDQPAANIASWDGTGWSPLGGGVNGGVLSLATFDDGTGPALYVGGVFAAAGGVPALRIARWDGASWSPVGSGLAGLQSSVQALLAFDDGTGPALYAGGRFTQAGDAPLANIARWDGRGWSDVGGGMDGTVSVLAVYDDGTGPALYAGGSFTVAGTVQTGGIAKWDGIAWTAVGGGIDGSVSALFVADDGTGPALLAGGQFLWAGGAPANHLARWDGTSWSPVVSTMSAGVGALAMYHDVSAGGMVLAVGGTFLNSSTGDAFLTRRRICQRDCDRDGTPDHLQIARDPSLDSNADGFPDACSRALGDFDLNGAVEFEDLLVLLSLFGALEPGFGDLNTDGIIDESDLAILIANWGPYLSP